MKTLPMTMSAAEVLTRFLSGPVFIRPDYFATWSKELLSPSYSRRQMEVGDDDVDVMPWDEPIYAVAGGIALVSVSGPIVKGLDALTCWWWGLASSDRIQDACKELAARDDVYAVVFHFRSPGGMAQGTPETAHQIAKLSAVKATIAFTDTQCCSAAYFMASQCRSVFTTISADVGCIGTYCALYDFTGMLDKEGIKLELFVRGKFKAAGIAGKPLTEEQRAFFDADIGRMNDRFLAAVRAGRAGVADETMEGQWFDGEQAVEVKLADAVVDDLDAVLQGLMQTMRAALPAPTV